MPDSIVGWSRRQGRSAKVAMVGESAASEPVAASASAATPQRPPSQSIPTPPLRERPFAGVLRLFLSRSANLVALLGWLIALLMVVYALFVVLHANSVNPWAAYVETWAPRVNLGLGGLVTEVSPTIQVLIDYGIAATLWAVIGTVISWLIRRIPTP